MKFQREPRYTVLKITDIQEALGPDETETLIHLEEKIAAYRQNAGKQPLACVVVESDWPEYEPTWTAIQERVECEAVLGHPIKAYVSQEPMWDWFGLSYSAYLVLPRVLLCGMPVEWQRRFVRLLEQAEETYDSSKINDNYTVQLKDDNNRFVKDPYRNYRHFPKSDLPYREKPAGAGE